MNKSPLVAIALSSLVVGFLSGRYFKPQSSLTPSTEDRIDSLAYKYVNPLLSCDSTAISHDKNLDDLRLSLKNLVESKTSSGQIDFASIYYRDMNNGPWFGINEKELFSPASLIKVPLMMTYLKKAETEPGLLQKEIVFSPQKDTMPQNILPNESLEANKKYTVMELIERMIKYSDNDAYYLLSNQLSDEEADRIYHDLGIVFPEGVNTPGGNIISVKIYASFFRILFNASYLTPEYSEMALRILSESQFKEGLIAGLPKDAVVAHKFGERKYTETDQEQLHDCGIVYLPKKPYLVCIMTRGKNFSGLSAVIKEASTMIYNHIK